MSTSLLVVQSRLILELQLPGKQFSLIAMNCKDCYNLKQEATGTHKVESGKEINTMESRAKR